jgi:hypothetical protein
MLYYSSLGVVQCMLSLDSKILHYYYICSYVHRRSRTFVRNKSTRKKDIQKFRHLPTVTHIMDRNHLLTILDNARRITRYCRPEHVL